MSDTNPAAPDRFHFNETIDEKGSLFHVVEGDPIHGPRLHTCRDGYLAAALADCLNRLAPVQASPAPAGLDLEAADELDEILAEYDRSAVGCALATDEAGAKFWGQCLVSERGKIHALFRRAAQSSRPSPAPAPAGLDLEAIAEAVHDAYLETCARLGWTVKESNRVPYADLSEDSKELDRASVRAVVAALSSRPSKETGAAALGPYDEIWVNELDGVPDGRYHFPTKQAADEFNRRANTALIKPVRFVRAAAPATGADQGGAK